MRYKKFRIRNFKGIKDATVDLRSLTGANVFTLVGLNESGKTTVLEAIHSFSPDYRSANIVSTGRDTDDYEELVPRHIFSTFTGVISVEATLEITTPDKKYLALSASTDELKVDADSIPDEIVSAVETVFERGNFVSHSRVYKSDVRVKKPRARSWRQPNDSERQTLGDAVYQKTPNIAYYPTFIFNFPDKIWLSDRGSDTSKFYRDVFSDVLAYEGLGFTIEQDIMERVRADSFILPWLDFVTRWREDSNSAKIRHIIDRAQRVLTDVIFGKWNQIFREDASDREVYIEFEVDAGKVRNDEGVLVETEKHDPYIKFKIKDGTRRFDVNDRSLGFRWFFAFLLFTQFRAARSTYLPTLFLFDEPASNLHAAAQQQLIDGFPEIARGDNMLIYSTHSHYMVDPRWLEQTFIVSNRSDAPDQTVIETAVLDDESLDIKVARYRDFVAKNPTKTSYFQPILDSLEVVPSRLDYSLPSIVFEGKSDYYFLRYAELVNDLEEMRLIPGLGAGTFEALIGISAGWGTKFLFVLDSDEKGIEEHERYILDCGAPADRLALLSDFDASLRKIEDLFDDEARQIIKDQIGLDGRVSKKHLLRFIQEQLAKGTKVDLGKSFKARSLIVLQALKQRLESL